MSVIQKAARALYRSLSTPVGNSNIEDIITTWIWTVQAHGWTDCEIRAVVDEVLLEYKSCPNMCSWRLENVAHRVLNQAIGA